MARWEPWNIVGGAYTDDAKPWSVQDTVNYLVVRAERPGGRSTEMLRGVPGLALFSASLPAEPVRGLHNAEGRLFAVVGSTLYLIGTDGAATSLGTIPGVGRVTFAHNQVTDGNQVVIANGQSGYVYNTTTGALTQITDPGFPGFRTVDFADQYVHGPEPFGRYWHHSNLADATDFNTLDRYEAEKSPDRVMQTITTGPDILVLGERTGQFFYNTGAATGTWANRQGAEFDRGAASPYTAVRIDNTVIWLGDDGSVYRLNGYSPARISTHAMEQELSRGTLSEAFAFAYEDRGHKCYILTVPDGRTWCFDVATQEWTRRESYGLNRWRVSSLVKWQGAWIAGDYANGRLYQLDWAVQTEAGEPLERRRTLPVLHDDQNKLIVAGLELVFDTGMDETSPPLPAPVIAALSITGDLPSGLVGDSGTLQYVVSGGVQPTGNVTITAGSLPPGATMNAAGLVTFAYTTIGTYSWTVSVTDADKNTATLNDSATICEQVVGGLTHTATLAGDDRVATLYANADGCGYAAGAYGITPPGTVAYGSFNATLTAINTGTYATQAGSPGDSRLFSLAQGLNGPAGTERWAFSGDDNFGYAELWKDGVFQCRVKPGSGDADNWFGIANGAGEGAGYAYLSWFDEGYAYVGLRLRNTDNKRRIYKWPLAASGSTVVATAISPELTAGVGTAGYYWTHLDRSGVLRALDKATGNLLVINKTDLTVTSTTPTGLSMADVGAFAVDADKLIVYRGGVVKAVAVYRLSDFSLITTVPITGAVYEFNSRLLCTDDSIFLQTGVNMKRIAYELVCSA